MQSTSLTGSRVVWAALALALALAASGCSDTTGSGIQAGPPALLARHRGQIQAGAAGQAVTIRPSVLVTDAAHVPVSGVSVAFSVLSGGGSISGGTVVTGADGVALAGNWVLGPSTGLNALEAATEGMDAVTFFAAGTSGASAPLFNIEIRSETILTPAQGHAFTSAIARWQSLLVGDLPSAVLDVTASCAGRVPALDETIDDIVIFAEVVEMDGVNGIAGVGTPCIIRAGGGLPLVSEVRVDAAEASTLPPDRLSALLLHEMAHALGFGSMWGIAGMILSPAATDLCCDAHFVGNYATAAFDVLGGAGYTAGAKVPVENTGGDGTRNVHWRGAVLGNELMTGALHATNPLSALTLRSLQDIGYGIDAAGVDAFSITLAPPLRVGESEPPFLLGDDVGHDAILVVDPLGNTVGSLSP